MLRDEIEIAIAENISTFVHGKESAAAADAVLALFKEWLGRESVVEAAAEEHANGWVYGTHPKDKARIVVAAITKELEK